MNKKYQKKKINLQPSKKIKKENNFGKIFSADWFFILLFFFAALIVYSNSFSVPFQFDDEQQILYRQSNHSFHNFTDLSFWVNVNNRPVSTFTLVSNYIINGDNVVGYHVVNFIIHLLSGIFLFFWLKLIISVSGKTGFSKWLPVVITLFFLVHPVQIQSVTYIVQRMTSLAGMFFLLSVFLYTKGRISYLKEDNRLSSVIYLILSLVAGILGTLSKQNAVVFPLAMLLTELFFLRGSDGKICKRYIITVVIVGGFVAVVYLFKNGIPFETKEITPIQYFVTQMTVVPRYFQMMILPFGLSIDHGVKVIKNFFDFKVICGASFLIGILVFAIFQIKKRPLVSFGIFLIFISLIIESSIFPIRDMMFEQRIYLSLAGFAIALWTLVFEFVSIKRPKLLTPLIIFVLLALSVGTFARNNVWNSRVEVWEKVTKMYPDHFRGWLGLGREYVASGERDVSKIIRCYERALEIEPENQSVLNDLSANYIKANKSDQAIGCLQKLENSENRNYRINALRTLGYIYLSRKDFNLSANYLNRVIQIDSKDTTALLGLSNLYIQTGDFNKGVLFSEKVLQISSDEPLALINIGYCYINQGRSDLSKSYLLKAIKINSSNTRALVLYANACVNTGYFDEAILYIQKAYEITNDNQLLMDIEKVKKMKK
jgi:protein O-mannosyl-transferase